MEPVRWGVLGVANIAVRAVIPALLRARNAAMTAIASRDLSRAQEAARIAIPRAYGSYEDLLDDPDVEAVYIPLPNSLHHEWTIRCAEAGKHVLCEKPLGLSAASCREMIDACREQRVQLMEAFMYRFHPRTQRVAEMVRGGAVGEPRMVRASFTFAVRDPADIRLNRDLGGGALYDVGCYTINVSRLLLGEPAEGFAFADIGASGVDEVTGGVLGFAERRIAVIDCGLRVSRRQEFEVIGTGGYITVPKAFLPRTDDAEIHLNTESEHTVTRIPGVDQYQLMVEHFSDVVRGTSLRLPPQDAVANLHVIEALLRSIDSRRAEPVGL